jgi:hypothetical protein
MNGRREGERERRKEKTNERNKSLKEWGSCHTERKYGPRGRMIMLEL